MSDWERPPSDGSDAASSMTPRDPRRPFVTSPFSRLARTHALGIAGDGAFAIGLAGSVFFSLDFNSARWRVALYLVLTIAPFAVAAPLIGPMIDRIRGGRRWIIIGSMAARAVLCVFVVRHLSSLLFYPEAFMMLVLGKVYSISKSAVVPSTVRSGDELVEANSKLTVISALAVVVAAGPAGLLLKLGGPGWALGLAALVFGAATVFAFQLPRVSVAKEPADKAEREELRSAGIMLASSAMAAVRGIVGFLAFMLAFDFKNGGAPLWYLGIVAATAQIGFFLGAIAAPRVRRVASEEQIIIATLSTIVIAGFLTSMLDGLQAAALLSMMVGATSSGARQAFDAIVQRDAPDANRGRTFARFEMRFQLIWVIGALLPIIVPIPSEVGFIVIATVALFAVVSYFMGLRRIRRGQLPIRRRLFKRKKVKTESAALVDEVAVDHSLQDQTHEQAHGSAMSETTPVDVPQYRDFGLDPTTSVEPTLVAPSPDPHPGTPAHSGAEPESRMGAQHGIELERRWTQSDDTVWEPPPGFVATSLDDDAATPPLVSPATPPATPPAVQKSWPSVFDEIPQGGDDHSGEFSKDVFDRGLFSDVGAVPEFGGGEITYQEPLWRDSTQGQDPADDSDL